MGRRGVDFLVWISLLLAIMFIVSFTVNLHRSIDSQIESEYADYQSTLAESAGKNLQHFFATVENEMKLLAKTPAVQELDVNRAYPELLEIVIRHSDLLTSVLLVNVTGEILTDPRATIHPEGFKEQVKKFYTEMLRNGGSTLSREILLRGRFFGFALGVPIVKDAADGNKVVTGMIMAMFSQPNLVGNLINPIKLKEGAAAFILSHVRIGLGQLEDREMILSVIEGPIDQTGNNTLVDKMLAGQKDTVWFNSESPSGEPAIWGRVMISYVPVKFANVTWSIAIMTPRDDITKLVQKSQNQSMLMAAFVALTMMIGAWVLIRVNRKRAGAEEKALYAAELTEKNKELEKLNKLKDDFVAIVSHDLRSPLGVILGYAKIMLPEAEKSGTNIKPVKAIIRSGERLVALINDILDLTRMEAGEMQLNYSDVRMEDLIKESFKAVQFNADSKGIKLKCCLPGEESRSIRADSNKIYQVLNNLIGNAIKFTPEDGSVTVTKNTINGNMVISIADTGVGLSKKEQETIFGKYKQAGVANEGSGLGLAICKNLVELHKGKIWVESEPGKGADFIFSLPIEGDTSRE